MGERVHLLGHSYGAQVALAAAALVPDSIRKLVLYEAAWPHIMGKDVMDSLEVRAKASDWDGVAVSFSHEVLSVSMEKLDQA